MKIVIVSLYNTEAYGVRSIHASLVHNGHDARMLFFKTETLVYEDALKKGLKGTVNEVLEGELLLFLNYVCQFDPAIVAFSLVSSHFHLYTVLCELLRTNGYKGKIVVGGWEASLNPERCIQYADYVCIGEGELAFCELTNCLENGLPIDTVLNFWIREKNRIIKNDVRPLNQRLSELSIPVFEDCYSCLIESNKVFLKDPYLDSNRYGTFIGLGCGQQCTYCSNSFMAKDIYPGTWSHIRFHNAERMKSELLEIKKKLKNVETINFYDEIFSSSLEWVTPFFAWYKENINIPFCATFFPGRCSSAMCEVLARSGMRGVWLGVQSGSERVRREVFKRYYSNDMVLKQAEIFHRFGVTVRYDFIFDNPFETFEESLESVLLMLQLPQPFSVSPFSLKFFPHTVISDMALEKGYVTEDDIVDRSMAWQGGVALGISGCDVNRSFINHVVSLIAFTAKKGEMDPNEILTLISNFKTNRTLEEITARLERFLK